MKHFRPYHFPPLAQRGPAPPSGDVAGQWQDAVADGFKQGQRDGYDVGHESGREQGLLAGHAEGMAQGLAEGLRQAQLQYEQAAAPLDAMLEALRKLRADYRDAQSKEVVELVGKVARQVIRAELALQPVQLLALVEEALAGMPPTREQVDVFLNPEELKRITELDARRAAKWNLLADPAMQPGECRVRAGDHEVDAGCNGRLVAVMEQVTSQLESAAERAAEELAA
jgi:flagellar assembly protein FliH